MEIKKELKEIIPVLKDDFTEREIYMKLKFSNCYGIYVCVNKDFEVILKEEPPCEDEFLICCITRSDFVK